MTTEKAGFNGSLGFYQFGFLAAGHAPPQDAPGTAHRVD